jgi:hypothetical protein
VHLYERTIIVRTNKKALLGAGAALALALLPGGGVAEAGTISAAPGPDTHGCGHGWHAKLPKGSGANLHHCGHGLHPKH